LVFKQIKTVLASPISVPHQTPGLGPPLNHDDNQQLLVTKRSAQARIYSPQWFILYVVMHVVNNIAFTAADVAYKIW